MDTIGNFLTNYGGQIGTAVGTGAQLYGQQNAGEAISKAATAGIGVANTAMGDVNSYWQPQRTLGTNADTALSSSLGIGGQPANYSNFMNMPGYGFAVQQGTQAAERQAAAMGNAGNSGTAAMIGNQVTGTAMQDYNNYINQLYQVAGLGSTANSAVTDARMRTAGNVEQLGINSGIAQSGMYTGMGGTLGGAGNYIGGPGASGVAGAVGGVGGLSGIIGGGLKALGGWLSGSNGGSPVSAGSYNGPGSSYSGFTSDGYASGMDPNNPYAQDPNFNGDSLYVPGAGQGGNADYIDPDSGFL
ncbi:MAG: hypothetical protein ACRETD_12980 [Steroidobacteraceae bacterium]